MLEIQLEIQFLKHVVWKYIKLIYAEKVHLKNHKNLKVMEV